MKLSSNKSIKNENFIERNQIYPFITVSDSKSISLMENTIFMLKRAKRIRKHILVEAVNSVEFLSFFSLDLQTVFS